MKRFIMALSAALLFAGPAAADYVPVKDRGEFLSLISGKELRLGLFRIKLDVRSDGTIRGSAQGYDVTGTWQWSDGYFCRQMDWGGTEIPYNCQLVEASGTDRMRFTVDRGAGRSAEFNLR